MFQGVEEPQRGLFQEFWTISQCELVLSYSQYQEELFDDLGFSACHNSCVDDFSKCAVLQFLNSYPNSIYVRIVTGFITSGESPAS